MLHCQLTCGLCAHLWSYPNTFTYHTVPVYTHWLFNFLHTYSLSIRFSLSHAKILLRRWRLFRVMADDSLILAVNRNFTGGSWTSTLYECSRNESGKGESWVEPMREVILNLTMSWGNRSSNVVRSVYWCNGKVAAQQVKGECNLEWQTVIILNETTFSFEEKFKANWN